MLVLPSNNQNLYYFHLSEESSWLDEVINFFHHAYEALSPTYSRRGSPYHKS